MRKGILILSTLLFFFSCKKDKNSKPAEPEKAVLIAPAKDEACLEGQILSDAESKVTLKWNAAQNADNYDVVIKNLQSNESVTKNALSTTLDVNLSRNTPYSWYVISKSGKTNVTAQSETWKFYNAGAGVLNYAPFPAEIVSPAIAGSVNATNGKITLDWTGNDVDNDIVNYDIYFGTSQTLGVLGSNVAASILNDVSVTANTTYYWKVVTRDSQGNTSVTPVYYFKVN
ncbi:hypothetical protein [Pedobacter sp. SYSU D00535]|uniref:hypothetical protein n=1 Tax=Pedobacter sp. SYSU D00535 TaxID=2810308 RepID=UPI001A958D95|nr:hypothetical protein [Pedobacter sp. SYSU D00535]